MTYSTGQWVSLKILKALGKVESPELQNFFKLQEHSNGEGEDSDLLIQFLDGFLHEGPNGIHYCLVSELLGPTIAWVSEAARDNECFGKPAIESLLLSSVDVLRLTIMLLRAVNFMHKAGFTHGGNTLSKISEYVSC
jgi:hypothetical protein